MDTYSRQLVFHGAVVLLVGLLCGAPYGRAVNRNAPEPIVHSWRVAHGSIPLGAALMFGVAAVLSHLGGGVFLKWAVALFLIVSSYAFCFSLPLAAVVGHSPCGAAATLDQQGSGFRITRSALILRAKVPNITHAIFERLAKDAELNCPPAAWQPSPPDPRASGPPSYASHGHDAPSR
jgi:hypothetical protein